MNNLSLDTGLLKKASRQPVQADAVNTLRFGQIKPDHTAPFFGDGMSIRFAGAQSVELQKAFLKDIQKNGVLIAGGAGYMGNHIAQNILNHGFPVYGQDITKAKDAISAKLKSAYDKSVETGYMTAETAQETLGNLRGTLGSLKDDETHYPRTPSLVIEAIRENLDDKINLFQSFDRFFGPDTILATNTSSLSVDKLAGFTQRPDKVVGLHYFAPAYKNRFIEVVRGSKTSEETFQKALAFVKATGKSYIVCKDSPGFVVNRIGVPLINEGTRLYDELKTGDPAYDKLIASAIDQVTAETLWPFASKQPGGFAYLKQNALLPIGTLNKPEYMGLIGEVGQILKDGLKTRYGNSYAPSALITQLKEKFQRVSREMEEKGKQEGWPTQKVREETTKAIESLKIPIENIPVAIPSKLYHKIQDRLLGVIFGVATQLLDEDVTTISDIERGLTTGLGWEVGPFELLNKKGTADALDLVKEYASLREGFGVATVLKGRGALGHPFPLEFIDAHREESTQYLTLNKPQGMFPNSLSGPIVEEILRKFKAAEADPDVKTIVIESVGGKNFCSGADLPWMGKTVEEYKEKPLIRNLPEKKYTLPLVGTIVPKIAVAYKFMIKPFLDQGFDMMNHIAQSPKVTIAKINGNALGGGAELALACDYIVASEEANIGLPEVKHGIFPAWGGTERLWKRIGKPLARWMILNGGFMGKGGKGPAILDGKDALAIGLVDKVAPALDLDTAVREFVNNLKEKGLENHKPKRIGQPPNLAGTRFEPFHWRYQTAALGELLDTELRGYYDKVSDETLRNEMKQAYSRVLGLAYRRIDQDLPKHPPKDLEQMMRNKDTLDQLVKKVKAAKSKNG